MKGAALGFSFLTLIIAIIFALLLMGAMVGVIIGFLPTVSLTYVAPVFVVLLSLNALIVYGLRRQKIWAVILGTVEVIALLSAILLKMLFEGFTTSLVISILFISLLASLLSALYRDYQVINGSEVTHV
ncbi:hypothetical protein [Glaciecola sp. SC05]|uniref:hypothetical protein n=1 Tax=Glaciecola sp. SC05 TaxID=1987355 RepID=UPI00352779F6